MNERVRHISHCTIIQTRCELLYFRPKLNPRLLRKRNGFLP